MAFDESFDDNFEELLNENPEVVYTLFDCKVSKVFFFSFLILRSPHRNKNI